MNRETEIKRHEEIITTGKLKNIKSENKIHICQHSDKCDIFRVTKQNLKDGDVEFLLDAHKKVKESGLYNFQGCRITMNKKLNLPYLRSNLSDYKDQQICDFLEFGFPLGYLGDESLLHNIEKKDLWKYKNHKGA